MISNGLDKAESVARAVLYEGYMLYPYRASSAKNRQRCTFGTLYPERHHEVVRGAEPCRNQTQCLVNGTASSVIMARVRFLQMRSRMVEAYLPGDENRFQAVEKLNVGGENYQSWDEGIDRTIDCELQLGEAAAHPRAVVFEFPPFSEYSELRDTGGQLAGRIVRKQLAISGRVSIAAEQLDISSSPHDGAGAFRLNVEVLNTTPCASDVPAPLTWFASAHTMLAVRAGEFVSLLDPPENLREAAAACRNIGVYPVLAGEPGGRDAILSSPIILYDYPQVAPESAGDFFDSTEIDELLTLRIMTLTDGEKCEMRNYDDRMRELLERTETTACRQLERTHGAVRSLRPAEDDIA